MESLKSKFEGVRWAELFNGNLDLDAYVSMGINIYVHRVFGERGYLFTPGANHVPSEIWREICDL